jgi:hypothetical protein
MTPEIFLTSILDTGIAWYTALPGWNIPTDDRARVLMLSIAGQESSWSDRVQQGNGPAHGYWQFERAGGVKGVLTHPATYKLATAACVAAGVPSDAAHAWGLMATEKGDHLAVAFARLLLWTDSAALPQLGQSHAAWNYYVGLWRPGRPRPGDWGANYTAAMAATKSPPVG